MTATTLRRRSERPTAQSSGDGTLQVTAFATPLGWMAAGFRGDRLARLTFGHSGRRAALEAMGVGTPSDFLTPAMRRAVAKLTRYAASGADELADIAVDYGTVTDFQRRVLDACRAIPAGETLSYAQLAQLAGAPGAARAVGNVMRTNRLPLVVPCHRVVGSGGQLGGYSAPEGLAMKRRLLALEGGQAR
jgi:methylated-DNA-[protein]-cysteine S-methyltransferase